MVSRYVKNVIKKFTEVKLLSKEKVLLIGDSIAGPKDISLNKSVFLFISGLLALLPMGDLKVGV